MARSVDGVGISLASRSRVKAFSTETGNNVKFEDVAGMDEAKDRITACQVGEGYGADPTRRDLS